MSALLKQYRKELRNSVLERLWSAWSGLGVMGGSKGRQGIVDPEALLLLTLECGREDPRLFDETLDWLSRNGEWINITRLSTLLRKDRSCEPSVVSAVAALLTKHDSSAKWKSPSQKFRSHEAVAVPLFLRDGRPMENSLQATDPGFKAHGWLRSPIRLREMSQPPDLISRAAFMLRCRAFFGVNMRADVWAYLMMNRHGTASCIARELGYTQPRVHEVMSGMHQSGAFRVRQDGNRKEYLAIPGRGWPEPYGETEEGRWRDWRAFARSVAAVWRRAFAMKEDGVTLYILDAEIGAAAEAHRNDFCAAGMTLDKKPGAEAVLNALRIF